MVGQNLILQAHKAEEADLGPAMSILTDQQRAFVYALLDTQGTPNVSNCYRIAYPNATSKSGIAVNASRLAHSEKIQAAVAEESKRRLHLGGIAAVNALLGLCGSANENVKLKAASTILDRVGMHAFTGHAVTVERTPNERQLIREIMVLAKEIGVDPKTLLGSQGLVIDAEWEETSIQTGGNIDWATVRGDDGQDTTAEIGGTEQAEEDVDGSEGDQDL